MANKILSPKTAKWVAGLSAILVGAAQITTPVDLKGMIPAIVNQPLVGGFSIMGIAAYGAVIGGIMVLMKRTE